LHDIVYPVRYAHLFADPDSLLAACANTGYERYGCLAAGLEQYAHAEAHDRVGREAAPVRQRQPVPYRRRILKRVEPPYEPHPVVFVFNGLVWLPVCPDHM